MATLASSPTTLTVRDIGSSALATMASSMAAGTWAQMSPTPSGLHLFTNNLWSSAKITGYATKMARDPNPAAPKIYYIGCDHNTPNIFVVYDELSNTWRNASDGTQSWEFPVVPWGPQTYGPTPSHGYEHTVYDWIHAKLYSRPFGEFGFRQWQGGTSWKAASTWSYSSLSSYGASAGCAFFPELGPNGSLVVAQTNGNAPSGMILGIDPVVGTKTLYLSGGILNPFADQENFCQYSPQHRCVVFGGGGVDLVTTKLWKLDASGNVTLISDNVPGGVGKIGPSASGHSVPVINPSNGHLLVLTNASKWYEYNLLTGVWTAKSGTASVFSANVFDPATPAIGTFACTIPEYNAVVFIKGYSGSSPAEMWLYKP